MTTETVLTDVEIGAIIGRVYTKTKANEIGELRFTADVVPIGRAIEQAVLQSAEVQALRKDAERYRHLRDCCGLEPHDIFKAWWLSENGYPQTLDAAIDAAMEKQK